MAEQKNETAKAEKAEAEVQKAVDVETEQGFRGEEVDETDNHAYTVGGVVAGEPTPESDPEQAEKAGSNKFKAVR